MTRSAWAGVLIACLVLVSVVIRYVPSGQGVLSRDGAITVVRTAGREPPAAVMRPPPLITPPPGTDAILTDGVAEKRAGSIITDFVARTAAPLAIERSSCERLHCRVIVYQTADYIQRGRKFYEDDKFLALARRAEVKSTSVSSYSNAERSNYVIDMVF